MFKLFVAVTAFAAAYVYAPPANAQTYPWCANYGGEMEATNCGFLSREQCMATLAGMGGYCDPNPFYRRDAERPAAKRKRPRG
jgi:uncharacterized protein DUF3551